MLKWVNGLLGLLMICALSVALYSDQTAPWRTFSKKYLNATRSDSSIAVIQIPTIRGNADRCATCHRAMLPGAKALQRPPHQAHPPIKGHQDLTRFGCTVCHGGQGRRLDLTAHHPRLGGGRDPFLLDPYLQARCARCHIPTGLEDAPVLEQGVAEYLKAGCVGCHLPGHYDAGLGPDLRRLGRRTEEELKKAILNPEDGHPDGVMFNLRWRYDQKTKAGRSKLTALITAILAFSEQQQLFQDAWANLKVPIDLSCNTCHREITGQKTIGASHRCTFLKQDHALRCDNCHRSAELYPRSTDNECPRVAQARPVCSVCHLDHKY